jgi:hypothetical protein
LWEESIEQDSQEFGGDDSQAQLIGRIGGKRLPADGSVFEENSDSAEVVVGGGNGGGGDFFEDA